jgi:acyl dehydratase
MRYYEDLVVGTTDRFGACLVTRDEVIDFASKYDAQPFHLSDEGAAGTYFGKLAASGWHTAAMVMGMVVEHIQGGEPLASMGSPGVDELRWIKPVYPGDTLRVEIELIDKRRSQSRRDMGISRSRYVVFNQHDEQVMSMIGNALMIVRDPDAPID